MSRSGRRTITTGHGALTGRSGARCPYRGEPFGAQERGAKSDATGPPTLRSDTDTDTATATGTGTRCHPTRCRQPVATQPDAAPKRSRATVLVAIAIVAVLAAGVAVWRVTAGRSDALPTAGTTTPLFTNLPARLDLPTDVVDLPTDRGVGPAALIYHLAVDSNTFNPDTRTFAQRDVFVVTQAGSTVPHRPDTHRGRTAQPVAFPGRTLARDEAGQPMVAPRPGRRD